MSDLRSAFSGEPSHNYQKMIRRLAAKIHYPSPELHEELESTERAKIERTGVASAESLRNTAVGAPLPVSPEDERDRHPTEGI